MMLMIVTTVTIICIRQQLFSRLEESISNPEIIRAILECVDEVIPPKSAPRKRKVKNKEKSEY